MRTTFSRNSVGWAFGANGLLNEHAIDVQRLDHDPATGERLGLLIEQQSTNKARHTDDAEKGRDRISNASYTVTANCAESPAGVNNADLLTCVESDGDNNGSYNLTYTEHISDHDSKSGSIFVKKDTSNQLYFIVARNSSANFFNYHLIDFENPDESMIYVGNGWYRISSIVGETRSYIDSLQIVFGSPSSPSTGSAYLYGWQLEHGSVVTSYINNPGSDELTRAADFFDAPGANNEYGPGLHTWKCAARMSRDPGEPTILGYADGRIYAKNGRLHLDGPGTLWQPDGEHAAGDLVPFYWTTQFAGAAPDFSLGRGIDDANWWNGHLVDIVPYPRTIRESEIRRELGL